MFDDEELPKKPVAVFTAAKLDMLSVAQMEEYIAELKGEVARVEGEIAKRGGYKSKAELFFKK